ncbi:Haloacid dehalogenase-like hydrolase (HAD) superfamily protein [Abeliophyllum distichum]|uniref:Haloacid dehalogenase-like hydrolase (HAD) superfamily protein n=1 Tax=Abeliophyllum distichum TaxID=126358 RepID=A0ABD1R1A5_9LAMI
MLSFRRVFSNVSTASVVDISNGPRRFKLKGCCSEYYNHSFRNNDDYNGVQNVKAYAPSLQPLLRDLEEVVTVEDPQNGPNSRAFSGVRGAAASANRGSSTRFQGQHFPEKIMVAVDVDEVLGNFISALNRFIANRYSLNHSISEYHVYEFFKIWNCSRDEADIRVHEFFETSYFKKGIHPIPGALKALQKSRQNAIKEDTIAWIEKHYSGIFQEIQFGNHFALDGQARLKSDICKSLGAKVLIDDNPRYAIECADAGIRVILFDYENSYPWCKTESVNKHPLVTRVNDWEEVQHLVSQIVS